MSQPELYGSTAALDVVRAQVERALAIQLQERDSTFYGGAYYVCREPELRLQRNHTDPSEPHDLAEPDFPTHSVLIYVFPSPNPEALRAALLALDNVVALPAAS